MAEKMHDAGRCARCRYGRQVYLGESWEMAVMCAYLLRRYERRPCPAGEKCTVFEAKEGKG